MQLSKKERHEIYKNTLHFFNSKKGLCSMLRNQTNNSGYGYYWTSEMIIFYPEFALFEPISYYLFWCPFSVKGIETRKTILEFCIEMTK